MNKAVVEPETFHRYNDFLEENIDPDSGLLDKLQSSNTLTAKEIRLIKHKDTFDQRNTKLLQYVAEQNKYNSLINALKETQQEHIANYLIGKGEYCPDFGDEWPLRETELSIVNKNQEVLIKLMNPEELVGHLYLKCVINERQGDVINSKPTCRDKNVSLLEILKRKSLKDFKVTIECLRESNQSHVANVLEHGGEYCPDFGDEWPLREAELSIVNKNQGILMKIISPDELVGYLYQKGVINERQRDVINSKSTCHEKNDSLLEVLRRRSLKDLKVTIEYLRKSNKGHVANILEHGGEYCPNYGDDWPLRESELSILKTNQEALIEIISPDELVWSLFSRSVITIRQRDVIMSKPTSHEKNESLLEILRRGSIKDFKATIKCLRESNQSHVAEVLEKGGVLFRVHAQGLDDTTEDNIIDFFNKVLRDIGLPIEEYERIQKCVIALRKGKSVVLYIYCRTLDLLMQLKVAQANGELLKSVQRLFTKLLYHTQNTKVTVQNFNKSMFTRLFHLSMLDELAVTLPMREYDRCRSFFPEYIKIRAMQDFNPLDMDSKQRDEFEDVVQSNNSNSKNPKIEFDWDKSQQSESENSDKSWKEHLNNYSQPLSFEKGDVMEVIPPINIGDTITWWKAMNLESGEIGYVPRRLVIIDYQMDLEQEYETSATRNQIEYLKSVTSNTSMNNLSFELLDSILQMSYLQRVLWEEQVPKNKDYHAISQLASVDCCWFQRIRRRELKKELWRNLIVFYRRKGKIYSVYRIHREFLEENIRLDGLVKRLKSNDYLTDVQAASLDIPNLPWCKKDGFKTDIISEILKQLPAIDSVLRRSPSDTKQHLIGEVKEHGGATVKVEIKFLKAETSVKTRDQNFQIVKRINEIRDTTKARSLEIEELLAKLKQDDLEILSASQDGNVIVVWIFCKNRYALKKLKTMNKSTHIMDIFVELGRNLSYSSKERNPARDKPKANIDFEQFKRTLDMSREENFPWDEAVHRHREFLVDRIFTEFGLLDKLRESDSISNKEIEKINEPTAFNERNRILLDIIIKRNRQHDLIQALRTTGQAHLVNYLKTDGTYYEEFHGDWPVNNRKIIILQENHENLIDLLDINDLLSRLYSTGVINKRQRDFINSKPIPYEKSTALLDILRRCSFSTYWKTIRCLHASNQTHVAEILEKGEAIAGFDTSVQGEAKAMNQAEEKEIAAGITDLLGNRSLPESNRILEVLRLNLVPANDPGRIGKGTTLEESFIAETEKPTEENISWEEAICRHREFLVERILTEFDLLDKLHTNDSISHKEMEEINETRTFYDRNHKLLDIIIERNKQRELVEALRTSGQLHLLNFLKTDGIYDARFSGEWPLTEKEIRILDENYEILVDLINIFDLLRRLYSTGVINRRQRDFINSKPIPYEKNKVLLGILRRCSLNTYWQTIKCLHLSNQSHIAEILEKGGVVVRIDSRDQGEAIAMSQAEEEIATEITNLLGNRSLPERNRVLELVQLNLRANIQDHCEHP